MLPGGQWTAAGQPARVGYSHTQKLTRSEKKNIISSNSRKELNVVIFG
jgi:hypothetical protein